jgi:hypothetical protein
MDILVYQNNTVDINDYEVSIDYISPTEMEEYMSSLKDSLYPNRTSKPILRLWTMKMKFLQTLKVARHLMTHLLSMKILMMTPMLLVTIISLNILASSSDDISSVNEITDGSYVASYYHVTEDPVF